MIRNRVLVLGLFAASAAFSAPILAPAVPGVTVVAGGTNVTQSLGLPSLHSGTNSFRLDSPYAVAGVGIINSLTFSSFDDPFINFGGAVTNTTPTTQTFTFSFISPYIGGPYSILRDSFSDSFTDGNGNGTVTIGLGPSAAFISQPQVDAAAQDGQGLPCTKTGVGGFSSFCNAGGNPTDFPIPTTGATGTFGDVVSFTLSPGDVYTFNGRVELVAATATPEPASWMLMAFGMGAVAIVFARKQRSA